MTVVEESVDATTGRDARLDAPSGVFICTGSQLRILPSRRLSLHSSAGAAARKPKVAFS